MNHAKRLTRLLGDLERSLLVTSLTNIRYLTGFTGSNAFLVAHPDGAVFLTDGRYGEVAADLVTSLPDTELVVYRDRVYDHLADAIGERTVQLEADHVTWHFVRSLRDRLAAEPEPATGIVEAYREIKDDDEIEALRRAAAAGDAAFARLPDLLAGAETESELGDRLVAAMKDAGGQQADWPPIVAAGPNAARPHHRAGRGVIGGGVLLLDYGCVVEGYHSDMTRTVYLGDPPDAEFADVYGAVLEANLAGIEAVRPGVPAGAVDEVCREVLRARGYEEHFLHSTGHGVGLEIHEAPSVRRGATEELRPGHVVTIEPGVYLPGRLGVRIEDMVLVTDTGHEVLTTASKETTTR